MRSVREAPEPQCAAEAAA